jgi:4-hydroxybenzoate polyprenyltransferase
MWQRLRRVLEMIRFSHTVFALPFALAAAVMAWTVPAASGESNAFRARDLLGILVCMVSARSAAMAFNRLADRRLDGRNPRTAMRHLPAGLLSPRAVAGFVILMSMLFVGGTLLFLPNRLPIILSAPVLGFLFGYSYAKRFTLLAHFWLGAALMLAPISAWIALRGELTAGDVRDLLPAAVLGMAVLCWVSGFDIIYACQDVGFDVRAKLHSVPARWGVRRALRLAAACHVAMVLCLVALPLTGRFGGPPLGLGGIYGAGILLLGLLLLYEHMLVKPDDLTRVNVAFFHVNAAISLGLFLLIAADLWI